jgi:hypothetical protein
MQYTIRRLDFNSKSDIQKWFNLYEESYGMPHPKNEWDWKYLRNPYGREKTFIYIAEKNGQIIGSNSFIPSLLIDVLTGYTYYAGQSGNSMVSKEFRKMGIFKNIVKFFVEDSKNHGFNILFGFARRYSLPGLISAGWIESSKFIGKALIIKPGNLISKKLNINNKFFTNLINQSYLFEKKSGLSEFNFEYISASKSIDQINNLHQPNQICVHRSPEYLKWCFERPNQEFQTLLLKNNESDIYSYIILKFSSIQTTNNISHAEIISFYYKDNNLNYLKKLISQMILYLKDSSIETINFYFLDSIDRSIYKYIKPVKNINFQEYLSYYSYVKDGVFKNSDRVFLTIMDKPF